MLEGGNIVHKCVHAYGYIYLPTNMNVFMDFISSLMDRYGYMSML